MRGRFSRAWAGAKRRRRRSRSWRSARATSASTTRLPSRGVRSRPTMSRWYEGARRAWAHVWPPLSVAERQAAPARGAQLGGAGGLHRSDEVWQAPVPEDGGSRATPATALNHPAETLVSAGDPLTMADHDLDALLVLLQALN